MGTTLADIIVPELFNPYVVNKTMEKSAFYQSGIITNNAEFNKLASQAAPTINMPFFEDLTGDSQQILESEPLTAKKITSNMDVSCIVRRASMWSATDLSATMSGADPMGAIGDLVGGFWARDMQRELIAILKGVFGNASMSNHILDISTLTGNASKLTASTFIDACQLLGDAQDQLGAVAMHSAVKSSLKKQNLIAVERPSTDVEFETYQGRRVIVDDNLVGTDGVYETYLFGTGALAFGNGTPIGFIPTEIDRDKKLGSGVDYLINRRTFILHPRGIKFTNANVAKSEGPSRAELMDSTNWKRVYEDKQIRMVLLKHKI